MTRTRIILVALSMMSVSLQSWAFLAKGKIEVSIGVIVNGSDGLSSTLCESSAGILGKTLQKSSISLYLDESPNVIATSKTGESKVFPVCRFLQPDSNTVTDNFTDLGKVTVSGQILEQMENERVLSIDIAQLSEENSGNSSSTLIPKRELFISGNNDVYIPVSIKSEKLEILPDIKEILLKISVTNQPEKYYSDYGEIQVQVSTGDGVIYLDGGQVGEIEHDQQLEILNVKPGLRVLSFVDKSGSRQVKAVNVQGDRVSLIEFNDSNTRKSKDSFKLVSLGTNTSGFEEYRREKDGAVIVKIPEGEFLMGNEHAELSPYEHRVYLSTYLIDKTSVSWVQYKQYVQETGIPMPLHRPYWGTHDNHPAVYVSWVEASNFCQWAGGRLPTEAEREKAARSTDGREYPWGESEPNHDIAVFRTSWGYGGTDAVSSHTGGASPYGLFNVGGNVWEWTADWFSRDYFQKSPYRNPKGPKSGVAHVVKGGSWDSRPTVLKASSRNWGHLGYRDGDFGFRCAMNVPE